MVFINPKRSDTAVSSDMMKKYFTLLNIFQFGEKSFGELQLPRNLRLGHCVPFLPVLTILPKIKKIQIYPLLSMEYDFYGGGRMQIFGTFLT